MAIKTGNDHSKCSNRNYKSNRTSDDGSNETAKRNANSENSSNHDNDDNTTIPTS